MNCSSFLHCLVYIDQQGTFRLQALVIKWRIYLAQFSNKIKCRQYDKAHYLY